MREIENLHGEFAVIISAMMNQLGIESAIRLMYRRLSEVSRLTRLSIVLTHFSSNMRLVLADVQKSGAEFNREVETAWLYSPAYREYVFNRNTGNGFYYPDIPREKDNEGLKIAECLPGVVSVFIMPLIRVDYLSASLLFGADSADAFSAEERKMFGDIGRAFADEFRKLYFPQAAWAAGADSAGLEEKRGSAVDLLRMCGGMRPLLRRMELVAPTDATVLVQGESGTGKELVARGIHDLSSRWNRPFITVNCGAITETLLLSELFGHERGAFTGATSAHPGFFEQADGGTIFLDEIAELSPATQAALLRVLGNKEVQRVGSGRVMKVNVRVIAASNRNLKELCEQGVFRTDLFYRLNVFPLAVPPLRARRLDIPVLAQYFLESKSKKLGLPVPELPKSELHRLCCAKWPGNVRQLEHVLEQGIIMSMENSASPVLRAHLDDEAAGPEPAAPDSWQSFDDHVRGYLERVIDHTGGKINGPGGACELLALSAGTLRGKLRKYNVGMAKKGKIPRVRQKA